VGADGGVDERVGELLEGGSCSVAAAESCTGGLVAARLVAIPGSGEWFRGGVVAYASEVKFDVLQVRPGPVVSERAAIEMARGARELLQSDVAVATTGVAGPTEEEGVAVGTVYLAAVRGDATDGIVTRSRCVHLDGDPDQVRAQAADAALELVAEICAPSVRSHG
jgi:nicotinamide-nucleotide amidase